MFRNLAGLTAVALGLAMSSAVEAAGPHGHRHHSHGMSGHHSHGMSGHHQSHRGHRPGYYKNYSRRHGHQFSHGHYYKGKRHGHWRSSYYSNHYRSTLYFDEGFGSWYYWCARRDAFFPLSYIEIDPPTDDLGPNVDGPDDEDE